MTVYRDKVRGVWIYDFWLHGRRYKSLCRGEDGKPVSSRRRALAVQERVRVGLRSQTMQGAPFVANIYTLAEAVVARAEEAKRLKNFRDIRGMLSEILDFFGPETPLANVATRWREYRSFCIKRPVRKWRGGPKSASQISGKSASRWVEPGRTRSAARVNRYMDQLGAVFRLAAETDTGSGQPLLAKMPRIEKLKEALREPSPVPLSLLGRIESDVDLPSHLRDAASLARLFGLRMAEVFNARTTWIDWEIEILRIPAEIAKSGREESLPANSEALALLRRLTAAAQKRDSAKDFLIAYRPPGRSPHGKTFPARPINSARRAWATALAKHSDARHYRFHDLRATYVTQIAHVATAATTQSLARHKSPLTTARYTKISDQARRAAVDAMASPHNLVANRGFKQRFSTDEFSSDLDMPRENAGKPKRRA